MERSPFGGGFRFHLGSEYVIYAHDELNQDWDLLKPFTKKSRVYNTALSCGVRIRTDVAIESRVLDGTSRQK